MIASWVLGSGGLVGSALCRALCRRGTELVVPPERFRWGNDREIAMQLASAVDAFSRRAAAAEGWEVYWAAGVGTMSSTSESLAPETRTLAALLRLLQNAPALQDRPGAIVFASSAGAIYAGSEESVITEDTPTAPNTAYAREKLLQEELLRAFADANPRLRLLIARLSTVYGQGQSSGKPQGLLTHIARCVLSNRPIQIYVPLDTVRDYIAADDAADAMVAVVRAMPAEQRVLTKIVASENPTSIAQIIALFTRIARRNPRVVTSAGRLTGVYPRRVRFQSIVAVDAPIAPRTSLIVGLSQVMAGERATAMRPSAAPR